MKRIVLLYLSLFIVLIHFSCNPDDSIIDLQYGPPALTATINGEAFSVDSLLVSASYSRIDEMTRTLAISGAPPAFNGIVEGITLALVSADSTEMEAGESYTSGSLRQAGAGQYFFENRSLDLDARSENTDIATITITELDFTNKVVSGTFSFDAIDEDNPGTVYEIREGKFINVSFE